MGKTRIVIHGAAGKMGQRLVALAAEDSQLQIVAAIESENHSSLGEDVGLLAGTGPLGIPLSRDFSEADVVIDFSVPAAAEAITSACVERKVSLVMATTGLSDAQQKALHDAAEKIAVLWAPSMSLAVNLTMKLAEIAGQSLKNHASGVDVEILERHHRFKEDAPSGTALKFGEIIAGVMGQTRHQHGREGRPGARDENEIGYHAIRVGDNPGEHTIVFGLLGETLELHVSATNRDAYALGALAAARFISDKEPGYYCMNDVLGL
ncbi:MAG TPA: 4-hydroxy-tetrahydrodipicolinate reductase [Pirellulales bacterium]|jgi:4-hydroxy-tetrahydrodipicolinate reductase|nr:4-hydroxy-tetrahydrodipicolinate reductase [Pirellulales bacterium]